MPTPPTRQRKLYPRPGGQDAGRAAIAWWSAGQGLLGGQLLEGGEVTQDGSQLVGRPRLAAVAAVLPERDEPEAAAGLVLGDREVPGGGVPVAGARGGAQPQAPAGDDDGAAVVP